MNKFNIKDAEGNIVNTIIADLSFVEANYDFYEEYQEPALPVEEEAKLWRNEELSRTDSIVTFTDRPDHTKYVAYRQILRDWPETADFPDTRPDFETLVVPARYTKLQLINALGMAAMAEIIASTDPMIKVIEKQFDAAEFVDVSDVNTIAALDYLAASADIPSMTVELATTIKEATI